MIDNWIIYIKNIPRLCQYSIKRLLESWKGFALLLLTGIIMILASAGWMKMMAIEELVRIRLYYRLASALYFIVFTYTTYKAFKDYKNDYWVTKSFSLSPIVTTILSGLAGTLVGFLLFLILIIFLPLNIELSVWALIFYLLIGCLNIILIAELLGLLSIMYQKLVMKIYWIGVLLSCFMVPILYIPKTTLSIFGHILMLNPLYYLVDGVSTSVIFGITSLSNLPYHIYFILFLVLIFTLSYWYHRHMAQTKYQHYPMTKINNENNKD